MLSDMSFFSCSRVTFRAILYRVFICSFSQIPAVAHILLHVQTFYARQDVPSTSPDIHILCKDTLQVSLCFATSLLLQNLDHNPRMSFILMLLYIIISVKSLSRGVGGMKR